MIYIDKTSLIPLNRQIYNCIVDSILSKHYKPFEKLPATRKLALELSVSRNTVVLAYQKLLSDGYISSLVGSGYTISDTAPLDWKVEKEKNSPSTLQKKTNDFTYENIANYLQRTRGIACDPSQIIITSGHQFSMEIIATLFQHTRKRLALETPGYDATRKTFEKYNYTFLPVPVEKNGVDTIYLKTLKANLLYLTPSHQTGSVLPLHKRLQVIQWAHDNDSYIIEDDYESELRYYTPPIPSIWSLDSSGNTIYVGTFSKALLPSLVAYLVLPKNLLSLFHQYNANI